MTAQARWEAEQSEAEYNSYCEMIWNLSLTEIDVMLEKVRNGNYTSPFFSSDTMENFLNTVKRQRN